MRHHHTQRRSRLALVVGILAAMSLSAFFPPSSAAQKKILPLGDSITQGTTADFPGYRARLWQMLQNGGYDVDFIGTMSEHSNGDDPSPGYDADNEGHSGWRADQVLNGCNTCKENTGHGKLSEWLRDYTPDIVLLHLGTNDAASGQRPSDIADELIGVINTLRADNPNVTVLVAKLIPTAESWNGRINTLNDKIDRRIAPLNRPGARVIVVDQNAGFSTNWLYDGLHPNSTGEEVMAQRWFAALEKILDPGGTGNRLPVASFVASPSSGAAPLQVNVDASGSSDADGQILNYSWDFGDGTSSSGRLTSHVFQNAGTFTIKLTVTDDGGATGTASRGVTVGGGGSTDCTLPAPWASQDIGDVDLAGSADLCNGIMTVRGGGRDIWGRADKFHFAYQELNGDGEIMARVVSQTNTDIWAKAGVMIRETLAANAKNALVAVTPGRGVAFEYRNQTDGSTSLSTGRGAAPFWVRLARRGNTLTGYSSADGSRWSVEGSVTISMTSQVYVGFAVTSPTAGILNTAKFSNINVSGQNSNLVASLEESALPGPSTEFALEGNFPNPFTSETIIRYSIPERASVKLEVFDLMGRNVSVLVDRDQAAGTYEERFDGERLPSGTYIFKLQAGSFVQTGKMILVR